MSEHGPSEYYTIKPGESDPKALSTVIVGAIGIAAAIAIVLGLEVVHRKTARAEFERKVVEREPQKLRLLHAEQAGRLRGYRWVDESGQQVSIPIERAMSLMVESDLESGGSPGGQ